MRQDATQTGGALAAGKPRKALVGSLGIGAQKCASSWIHSVAGSHPEIGVSDPKELDFFSYHFNRGYRWYESHFSGGAGSVIRFENSPSYFHDPLAPERTRAYNPDLKIVLMLRDPIKRAFSNHLHEIMKGHIDPITFEEGLINNPSYVQQGLYATHLAKWRESFNPDQILVLFAEEVTNDPGAAARALFGFLGVDEGFDSAILYERRNESDRARLPALRGALRACGNWMRKRDLEPVLARIKALPPAAQILRINRIEMRDEVPPMRSETVDRLANIFAEEMAGLRSMLGRNRLPWEAEQDR